MLGFQGEASRLFYSFFFFFFFLFFSFFLEGYIGLLLLGVLNLLQVVNETRFCEVRGARQFPSVLKKTDVHCVWLAKSGRRRMKTMRFQMIIDLIMHGTNLTSIALSSVLIFQLVGKAKPQNKKNKKMGAKTSTIFELRR